MRNKTWLVFRMQVITAAFNLTFLMVLLSMPLLSVFSVLGISALNQDDQDENRGSYDQMSAMFGLVGDEILLKGIVDQSGLIVEIPEDFGMQPFDDEDSARRALEEGEISGLYVVQPDYLQSGKIAYYEIKNQGMAWFVDLRAIEELINDNLLASNESLRTRFDTPFAEMKTEYLSREAQLGMMNLLSLLVPVGMATLFYLTISSVASLLFESLVTETSNQTIEVLMTSLHMRQLLIGKVLALGLVGLLLEISWVGLSALGFSLTGVGQQFDLPVTLTPQAVFWGLIFFLLGYMIYAALITSIGALVQRLREQWHLLLVVMMPLFVPLMYLLTNTLDLNNGWWIFLSLFPLTSPVAMFSRLILTDVPAWQVVVSIVLLLGSSYLILRLAVRLFRAQYLLAPHPWLAIKHLFRRVWGRLNRLKKHM